MKIAKLFFAALAMTAAVSCTKELAEDIKPSSNGKGVSYVIEATRSTETKAVLDENTMRTLWGGNEEGVERIAILDPATAAKDTYVAKVDGTSATATFTIEYGEGSLTGTGAFAVYPEDAVYYYKPCSVSGDVYTLKVQYPAYQDAVEGSFDPNGPVAVAYNANLAADNNLQFQNVSALLRFQFAEDTDVAKSVRIIANGGEMLAGDATLTMENGNGTITLDEYGSDSVTLRAEDGFKTGVNYYLAVAPAVLSEGFSFEVNGKTYTNYKQIDIKRNRIYDLGTLTYEAAEWYIVDNSGSFGIPINAIDMNFYRASGVELKAGQQIRLYNKADDSYVSVEAPTNMANRTLYPLTESDAFGTILNDGTYDIYVSYHSDYETNEDEFGGIYLYQTDAPAVENVPTLYGKQVKYMSEYGYPYVLDIAQLDAGYIYSAFDFNASYGFESFVDVEEYHAMYGMPKKYLNNYFVEGFYGDCFVVPFDETSGEVVWVVASSDSGIAPWEVNQEYPEESYYKIQYSNLTENSVDLLSISRSNSSDYEPVFDKDGNYIYNATWYGLGISYTEDWSNFYPIEAEIPAKPYDIVVPSPDQMAFSYFDYETYEEKFIDFGSYKEGTLVEGLLSLDEENWTYSGTITKTWTKDGFIVERSGPDSGTITWTVDGKEYTIEYSDYDYWTNSVTFFSSDIPAFAAGCQAGNVMIQNYTYPSIDGKQYLYNDGDDDYVLDLGVSTEGIIYQGLKQDGVYMASAEYDADYTVTPYDETSGEITFELEVTNWGGTSIVNYRILYSDMTDTSVKLLSINDDEYSGMGISITDDFLPVSATLAEVDLVFPSIEGYQLIYFNEDYSAYYLLDLGQTIEGSLIFAQMNEEGAWAYKAIYEDFKVEGITMSRGKVSWDGGSFEYSNYDPFMGTITVKSADLPEAANEANGVLAFGEVISFPSPDAKQWTCVPEMMGVPFCFDLGVTTEGVFTVAYDAVAMNAPEGTPYQIFGNPLSYIAKPAGPTSGVLVICSYDDDGNLVETEDTITYTDFTGESCTFGGPLLESMFGEALVCGLVSGKIDIAAGGVAM